MKNTGIFTSRFLKCHIAVWSINHRAMSAQGIAPCPRLLALFALTFTTFLPYGTFPGTLARHSLLHHALSPRNPLSAVCGDAHFPSKRMTLRALSETMQHRLRYRILLPLPNTTQEGTNGEYFRIDGCTTVPTGRSIREGLKCAISSTHEIEKSSSGSTDGFQNCPSIRSLKEVCSILVYISQKNSHHF